MDEHEWVGVLDCGDLGEAKDERRHAAKEQHFLWSPSGYLF